MTNNGIKGSLMGRILFILGCSVLTLVMTASVSCSQHNASPSAADAAPEGTAAAQPEVAAAPPHYYALRAGDEYGYEAEVSDYQRKAGQVAAPLVMIRFAGERKGKYQIFLTDGQVRTVFDCERPCEFVRVRTFVDEEETTVERIRRVKGSIAYYAMEDAMHGQLAEHFIMKKGVRLTLWYSD